MTALEVVNVRKAYAGAVGIRTAAVIGVGTATLAAAVTHQFAGR